MNFNKKNDDKREKNEPVYSLHHVNEKCFEIVHFFRSLDVLLDGEHHQDFAVFVAPVDVELAVTFEPRIQLLHRHVWK